MKNLDDLIANIKSFSEIVVDSRKVSKDCVFVAIKGLKIDSHDFIADAIQKGAKVIVGEQTPKDEWLKDTVYIKVDNSREALGMLASAWYDNPSHKLKVIGVTGTDGKTTTSNIIWWILTQSGKKAGLISTINARIGDKVFDTGFHVTNPEALDLQHYLSLMVEQNCEYAVLEVTSHGIDQGRVAGVKFDIAVLTNITHEHLDYHKTYENYLAAKARLFKNVKIAILNKDDSSFEKVQKFIDISTKIISYGKETLTGKIKNAVNKKFAQDYNRLNATAAIQVAKSIDIADSEIQKAIETFEGLIGRMEEIKNNKGIKIIVDFAHTPNALTNVLKTLSKQKGNGRLICVFGCAGERDIQKRILMPKAAIELADFSVFTAEDPRSEKIEEILSVMKKAAEEIEAKEGENFTLIPERGEAISVSINEIAKQGDTVVICGKGHEQSMAYNGVEYPWSDQEAVKKALVGEIFEIQWKK